MFRLDNEIIGLVSKETEIKANTVTKVIELLEEGNTVPFIARYRKEMTSGLDEVEIKLIQDTYEYATQLKERKEEVTRLIDEQDKLTEKLAKDINAATKLQRLEDLYRPYRKKRRTRATIAQEKGLEPLAKQVYEQAITDVQSAAKEYFSEEHEKQRLEMPTIRCSLPRGALRFPPVLRPNRWAPYYEKHFTIWIGTSSGLADKRR